MVIAASRIAIRLSYQRRLRLDDYRLLLYAHSDCDERCSFLRDFIIIFLLRDCIQPGRSLQNWDQQGRNPAKSISSTKDDLNLSHALVGDYFLDQVWLLGAFQTICGPRCPAVDFLEGRTWIHDFGVSNCRL